MTSIRLRRDNDSDLIVEEATLVAGVTSAGPGRCRWTELRLWRTAGGKLVAEQVGRSSVDQERDRCKAWVCLSEAEVIERLGHGWLAHRLYEAAGIDDSERVD